MSRRRCLQYGFLLGLLISVVFFLGWMADSTDGLSGVLPALGDSGARDPVLVFVVGDPRAVERVLEATAVERVVYASDDAVASVEGRIVAVDHEAVGRAINAMNWVDREIEMVEMPRSRFDAARAAGDEADDAERRAKLTALMKKDRLNRAEQLVVLQAMSDGVDF